MTESRACFKEPTIGPLKSKMAEIRHLESCRLNAKTRFLSLHIMDSCYALAIIIPPPPTEKPNYAMDTECRATAELLVKYKLVCYWLVLLSIPTDEKLAPALRSGIRGTDSS